ncbi:MAG: DNA/RNA non-specific endonuclease [Acetivibrio ethanolgignens]
MDDKKTKRHSKFGIVFRWSIALFLLMTWVYGFNLGTILISVVVFFILPIKQVDFLWDKLKKRRGVSVAILTIILLAGFANLPEKSMNDEMKESNISTEEKRNKEEETVVLDEKCQDIKGDEIDQEIRKADFDVSYIPEYENEPYVIVNENEPFFTDDDLTTTSFEKYSDLDEFGRCGVCFVNVEPDIMPTEERGEIGQIKPTGWHTVKYENLINELYLYNRCHLIAYQLSGENANEKNLITGTRYMNVEGMLPFEKKVAEYVQRTGNHVLYRVTPVFENENMLASGVLMEAKSVEDDGEGVSFCVYCYNVQPGININYKDGESEAIIEEPEEPEEIKETYVLNNSSKKFHKPECSSVKTIKDSNRSEVEISREDLINSGYDPCKRCNP